MPSSRLEMENQEELRVAHPRHILYQVAKAMNGKHNDLRVTLPSHSTWKTAIRAAEEAMGDVDESIYLMPQSTGSTNRQRVHEMALDFARNESTMVDPWGTNYGRRIRTRSDIRHSGAPQRASANTRQRLRETAKKMVDEPWKDPYANIHVGLTEGYPPIVTANLRVYAIDDSPAGELGQLDAVEMIWDTGAHRTIITEKLLPQSFREYLRAPIHDPYRSSAGSSVQIDAEVALSNDIILINTLAIVLPQAKMPNQLRGILFGQISCINRIRYESISRDFLLAKGENVGDDVWGDLIVKEYLNEDDNIVIV